MTARRTLVLALALGAGLSARARAHADVWQHASAPSEAAASETYRKELAAGDSFVVQANRPSNSPANIKKLLASAEQAYRNAAAASPREAEPYFRIARVLYSFYFECADYGGFVPVSPLCDLSARADPSRFDTVHAQEVIHAWAAAEQRAPLDPHFSIDLGESEVLFRRAILNTRLATKTSLAAAAEDYERFIARSDVGIATSNHTVWSNLAETYMMLGRLDDAIDTYHEALRRGAQTSTQYGLAVALDRDGRSAEARDRIVALGKREFAQFQQEVARGDPFFVPLGEKYYYFALMEETFGHDDDAVEYWRAYIKSNAHPEFQPRAKAHLDHLLAERKKHPARVTPPPLWDEL